MNRLVPLTGVAFVVVAIASFGLGGDPPGADKPAREIVEHYTDDSDMIQIGAVLTALAGVFLVFFGGYLRRVLSAAERDDGMLPTVALVGTAVMAIGAAIDATISFSLADAAEDIEPTAVQALQALWDNDFIPIAMGTEIFLIATGLSVVRTGALPKWLGWVALVLALIGLTPAGFAAFAGGGIWILVVSILLAVRAPAATGRPPAGGSGPAMAGPTATGPPAA
jgi:hypothetical protein